MNQIDLTVLVNTLNELRVAAGKNALQFDSAKKMGRATLERTIAKLEATAPAEEPKGDGVPETLEARLAAGYSPWGGHPSSQTAAGQEGTFLGDSCLFCHEFGKTYNAFTGEEVDTPTAGSGKKRRVLNPQGKIDAKVEALLDVGVETSYNRPARLWNFKKGKKAVQLTSREFAEYTTDELTKYIAGRLGE